MAWLYIVILLLLAPAASLVPLALMLWLVMSSIAMYRRARAFDDFYARSISVENSRAR